MFNLFLKECKQLGKSLIYIVFICIAIAFYTTQYYSSIKGNDPQYIGSALIKPSYVQNVEKYNKENDGYPYGSTHEEIPKQVMPKATSMMYEEHMQGIYRAYPYGFVKKVKLSKEHTKRIEEILSQTTGESLSELDKLHKTKKWNEIPFSSTSKDYAIFKKLMEEANNIIGKQSNYSKENLRRFGVRPITYEESMKTYKDLIEKDKITNGFARIFSDYMGIVMGLFPVFVVVSFIRKDRKSNMKELIYSRRVSSAKLILSRYSALVIMMMIPIFLLAIVSTLQAVSISEKLNLTVDYFAFFKYSIGWLMPTLMAVTAVSMFLTLLTETAIAIPVQMIWWYSSVFKGVLIGSYDLSQLVIRFNTIYDRDEFVSIIYNIFLNRIFFISLSAIFVIASIYILNLKRIGRIDFYDRYSKCFTNFKGKFKNSFSK
ncbi:ABC transporter permease [Clostridium estertheticum]|uniref:ABC transporter permease n=1 Tax=Clostridium estertheticum TaxID=238834 RepID=A0A7Y3SZI5_9CLOT|nr:ABC transporter permease [Clostridium estertheticum]NNU78278.1 ABC transporter permease [Clostridium estertheticum]WBL45786.1 ABC transporter permease [Clostridium estertheticum]